MCFSGSLHLMVCGCYRPSCLHLPWCKAVGVRLDRTKTKAPFYSPGSPAPSLLGAKHCFSVCWERGWPFPVSQHETIPSLCPRLIDHLQAVIYNIFYSTTRIFWFSDPKILKTYLPVWPFAIQQIWVTSATACLTHPLIIKGNPKQTGIRDHYPSTALKLGPVCPHRLTQGSQGVLKPLIITHPKHPPEPEGISCTLLEFGGLPTRSLTN